MISQKALDPKGGRSFRVITDPTTEPITVDEVKTFAHIDGVDEDSLLGDMITAVRQATELYLGRALITQTIRLTLNEWNQNEIELPRPPLLSVTKVATLDEDDTETEIDLDNFYAVSESIPGKLVVKDSYSIPYNTSRDVGGYRIEYTAGYGSAASNVPVAIRMAMMLWVATVYESRVVGTEPPPEAKKQLTLYRVLHV